MAEGRAIRWGRILLEAVVIVASILLALAAEALWQQRTDRAEEQLLLRGLHEELIANEGVLSAQADSISAAIDLLDRVVGMSSRELDLALGSPDSQPILMAIQRPWTVEFRVGALESTVGTDKASLIRDPGLRAELAQYSAVRHELAEIGSLSAAVSVDAFVSLGGLPETYGRLVAVLKAKLGYWRAYRGYLARFIEETRILAALVEDEIG